MTFHMLMLQWKTNQFLSQEPLLLIGIFAILKHIKITTSILFSKKLRQLWLQLQHLWLIRLRQLCCSYNNCGILRELWLVLRQLWTLRQLWSHEAFYLFGTVYNHPDYLCNMTCTDLIEFFSRLGNTELTPVFKNVSLMSYILHKFGWWMVHYIFSNIHLNITRSRKAK